MYKKLPIGISDFKEIIDEGYAYVDKTLFIKELMERGSKVVLIPRMRRFGKTLNLSMLRYFFEKNQKDMSYLFKNLKIWSNEKYRQLQGEFPVILISLKDIKHATWEKTFESLKSLIAKEFRRHRYLIEEEVLTLDEKSIYNRILFEENSESLFEASLAFLSEWLHRYHHKRVFLLIDEYDTPAHAAYIGGYYNSLIAFLRNWLSAGLKDNSYLERGVLTGILRIAKESIFSGLNNITTFTILDNTFSDQFGLLESEVNQLLDYYGLTDQLPDIRKWYNGYRIGSSTNIYNPWSVLNCIAKQGALAPYWVNTSDNGLIKQLIAQAADDFKIDLELVIKGEVFEQEIEEGIVFSELHQNPSALWSLLLYCGYLTLDRAPSYGTPCRLRIPNVEVAELYQSMILGWFKQTIHQHKYQMLLQSLTSGDVDTFSRIFTQFMISSASVFDVPADDSEKIYHAFVLGLLIGLKERYNVQSNRESGYGRYDISLFPKSLDELGILIEFKKVSSSDQDDLELAANNALKQIEEKKYAQALFDYGVKRILYLGIAFKGKQVFIAHLFIN